MRAPGGAGGCAQPLGHACARYCLPAGAALPSCASAAPYPLRTAAHPPPGPPHARSYFFEKCLGWRGVCIEASPTRAAQLRQKRTCKVIEACVHKEDATLRLSGAAPDSINDKLDPNGGVSVRCASLTSLLTEAGIPRGTHIDYMSLDIEAAEVNAILGFDWTAETGWPVHVLDVETFWLNNTVHQLLWERGFVTVNDVGPDHVFVRREGAPITQMPNTAWARDNTNNFRHERQKSQGWCFDDQANPGTGA